MTASAAATVQHTTPETRRNVRFICDPEFWPIAGFCRQGHDYPKVLPDQYPKVLSGSCPHRKIARWPSFGSVRTGLVMFDEVRLEAKFDQPAVELSGDIGLISWK